MHKEVPLEDKTFLVVPIVEEKIKGDCWRVTGACLGCGSMEHKIRECTVRPFIAPQTGGNVSSVQKCSKSVASSSVPRQGT